jgi:hypothetical protein
LLGHLSQHDVDVAVRVGVSVGLLLFALDAIDRLDPAV